MRARVLMCVNVSWAVSDLFKYLTSAPEKKKKNFVSNSRFGPNSNFHTGVCVPVCCLGQFSVLPIRLSAANGIQQVEIQHAEADTLVMWEI